MQVSTCVYCGKQIHISDSSHSAQLPDLHEECSAKLSQEICREQEEGSENPRDSHSDC